MGQAIMGQANLCFRLWVDHWVVNWVDRWFGFPLEVIILVRRFLYYLILR